MEVLQFCDTVSHSIILGLTTSVHSSKFHETFLVLHVLQSVHEMLNVA